MFGDLGQLGLTQNNCSLNSFSDIMFIGNWTVLQIMSGDLGQLGLTQNNCSLNSLLVLYVRMRKKHPS